MSSWQVIQWTLPFNLLFIKPPERVCDKSHRKSISGFPQNISLSLFVVSVKFHVGYLRLLHLSTRPSCSLACDWRASLLHAWSCPLHNILRTVTRCLPSVTFLFFWRYLFRICFILWYKFQESLFLSVGNPTRLWHSEDRVSWYILIIKPTRCTNFSNLFLE